MKTFALLSVVCFGTSLLAQAAPQHDYPTRIAQQVAKVHAELEQNNRKTPFQTSWESLASYRTPDWFRDAKFGIFIHWGVYSVPAFGNEWYSRNMYIPGNAAYQHQVATYGSLEQFGYKDFIPLFHAQHFDANAWLDLFVKAGARYVVPVAEHCDGFAMYASSMTPYNAAEMGPHRDVVGELERATRARGLRFGVSSHTAEHWWWYGVGNATPSDVRNVSPHKRVRALDVCQCAFICSEHHCGRHIRDHYRFFWRRSPKCRCHGYQPEHTRCVEGEQRREGLLHR